VVQAGRVSLRVVIPLLIASLLYTLYLAGRFTAAGTWLGRGRQVGVLTLLTVLAVAAAAATAWWRDQPEKLPVLLAMAALAVATQRQGGPALADWAAIAGGAALAWAWLASRAL
jgi:hypothetical protein